MRLEAKKIAVLEDYFGEKVEEVRDVEARMWDGGWYQVVPADEVDDLEDDEELAFVKNFPAHWFGEEKFYIVRQ